MTTRLGVAALAVVTFVAGCDETMMMTGGQGEADPARSARMIVGEQTVVVNWTAGQASNATVQAVEGSTLLPVRSGDPTYVQLVRMASGCTVSEDTLPLPAYNADESAVTAVIVTTTGCPA